jgi:hypothetical protein
MDGTYNDIDEDGNLVMTPAKNNPPTAAVDNNYEEAVVYSSESKSRSVSPVRSSAPTNAERKPVRAEASPPRQRSPPRRRSPPPQNRKKEFGDFRNSPFKRHYDNGGFQKKPMPHQRYDWNAPPRQQFRGPPQHYHNNQQQQQQQHYPQHQQHRGGYAFQYPPSAPQADYRQSSPCPARRVVDHDDLRHQIDKNKNKKKNGHHS